MKEIKLQDNPDVSIIVPVYNSEKFVGQTLDCLVKQAYPNIEIIVVDDGSTDSSKDIVDKFSFDRRLKYFRKENGGTGSALNLGHDKACGKYFTWCSADNIYFPNFVTVLLGALKKSLEHDCHLVYSDFCFVDQNGRKLEDIIHKKPQTGKDLIEGYDVGMSFMYTRELWEKTGYYWEKICEDFNFAVRAAQHTKFGLVNAILAAFRVHGNQITGSNTEKEKVAADECKALAYKLFGDKDESGGF